MYRKQVFSEIRLGCLGSVWRTDDPKRKFEQVFENERRTEKQDNNYQHLVMVHYTSPRRKEKFGKLFAKSKKKYEYIKLSE